MNEITNLIIQILFPSYPNLEKFSKSSMNSNLKTIETMGYKAKQKQKKFKYCISFSYLTSVAGLEHTSTRPKAVETCSRLTCMLKRDQTQTKQIINKLTI